MQSSSIEVACSVGVGAAIVSGGLVRPGSGDATTCPVLTNDGGGFVASTLKTRVACASSVATRAIGVFEHAPPHAAVVTSAAATTIVLAFNLPPLEDAVCFALRTFNLEDFESLRPTRLYSAVVTCARLDLLSVDGTINMERGH